MSCLLRMRSRTAASDWRAVVMMAPPLGLIYIQIEICLGIAYGARLALVKVFDKVGWRLKATPAPPQSRACAGWKKDAARRKSIIIRASLSGQEQGVIQKLFFAVALGHLKGLALDSRAQASNGAFGDGEIGAQRFRFIFTHQQLIFQEARAARRALGVVLKHVFHMRQLRFKRLSMLQQVIQRDIIARLAAEEEFGEKLIFDKARWCRFLEPGRQFLLALGRQLIELAVGAMVLND